MLSDQVPYYILDLLQQTPSVYVKGLGRFEAIFHPAVMDIPGSRIKPPYIQPAFNNEESDEDMLLSAYIHYTTGADKAEIQHAIDDFVGNIKDRISRDENYVIDQFGSFSKSSTGGLRFTPDWDAFNLSFSGLEVIDLHPRVESVDRTRYTEEPYKPQLTHTPAPITESKPIEAESKPVLSPPEFIPVESRPQSSMDETSSRLWWTILASALVLITVLCAYLAWDILSNRKKLNELVQQRPDSSTSIQVTPTPAVADTTTFEENTGVPGDTEKVEVPEAPSQEVPETRTQENPVTSPVENPEPDPSACYVVVGAFKDASNVSRMEERVLSMGFEVEKISGGTLTRVAIRSSCDKQVLQQTLNAARAKLNPEAWIY